MSKAKTNSAEMLYLPSAIQGRKAPTMVTVKEAAAATRLPEGFLRSACHEGTIAHIRSGQKIYINLDRLFDYLNGIKPAGRSRNGR